MSTPTHPGRYKVTLADPRNEGSYGLWNVELDWDGDGWVGVPEGCLVHFWEVMKVESKFPLDIECVHIFTKEPDEQYELPSLVVGEWVFSPEGVAELRDACNQWLKENKPEGTP